jgi:hypothetical protein
MDHALISSNLPMQKLGRRGPLFLFYIKRALKNSGEILLFANCKCRHAIQVPQVSAPYTKHKSEICVKPNFCGHLHMSKSFISLALVKTRFISFIFWPLATQVFAPAKVIRTKVDPFF